MTWVLILGLGAACAEEGSTEAPEPSSDVPGEVSLGDSIAGDSAVTDLASEPEVGDEPDVAP